MNGTGLWGFAGYVVLFAAIIDFVAAFVWFARGESGKGWGLIGTGILLLAVSLGLIFLPTESRNPKADIRGPASVRQE